jgi:hypothetical protein
VTQRRLITARICQALAKVRSPLGADPRRRSAPGSDAEVPSTPRTWRARSSKTRQNLCNESAWKLLPGRFARFSHRNLAKDSAGQARRRPPTDRSPDKSRPGAASRIGRIFKCVADITLDCQKTPCGFVGSQIGRRAITVTGRYAPYRLCFCATCRQDALISRFRAEAPSLSRSVVWIHRPWTSGNGLSNRWT